MIHIWYDILNTAPGLFCGLVLWPNRACTQLSGPSLYPTSPLNKTHIHFICPSLILLEISLKASISMTFGACGSANSHLTPCCIKKNNKKKRSRGDQEGQHKLTNAFINSTLSWKKIKYISLFVLDRESLLHHFLTVMCQPCYHNQPSTTDYHHHYHQY